MKRNMLDAVILAIYVALSGLVIITVAALMLSLGFAI